LGRPQAHEGGWKEQIERYNGFFQCHGPEINQESKEHESWIEFPPNDDCWKRIIFAEVQEEESENRRLLQRRFWVLALRLFYVFHVDVGLNVNGSDSNNANESDYANHSNSPVDPINTDDADRSDNTDVSNSADGTDIANSTNGTDIANSTNDTDKSNGPNTSADRWL
jgi:hypothetical protein